MDTERQAEILTNWAIGNVTPAMSSVSSMRAVAHDPRGFMRKMVEIGLLRPSNDGSGAGTVYRVVEHKHSWGVESLNLGDPEHGPRAVALWQCQGCGEFVPTNTTLEVPHE